MFTEERQATIVRFLLEKGKVRVKELSEEFQVTEDCIRKDLKALENAGRLKRTYGGAILSQDYPLERDVVDRRNYHLEKKKIIAAKAMELIKNNETIFLDISTTNIELAHLIASSAYSREQYDRYSADSGKKQFNHNDWNRRNHVSGCKWLYGGCYG